MWLFLGEGKVFEVVSMRSCWRLRGGPCGLELRRMGFCRCCCWDMPWKDMIGAAEVTWGESRDEGVTVT